MDDLISLDNLIALATKKGVNFGKGDPYNRLRYYTKLGLLPHMVRKTINGEVVGHYPKHALDTLLEVEKLKSLGLANDQISQKLKLLTTQDQKPDYKTIKLVRLLTPSAKTLKLVLVGVFSLMILAGFGVLPVGKSKNDLIQRTLELDKRYILDSGTAYIPKDQKKIYIKSGQIKLDSKINVTFSSDFTPASRYWISQKVPFEGFYLELDAPTSNDAEFSWWVSN
jgi:DNA-binding transcriptional MerR regulator